MRTLSADTWKDREWATYLLWCFRRTHFAEPHDHDFHELFWVESGQGQYWINGKVESLRAGDLILVRPEDAHSFAAAKEGEFMEFVNVAFRSSIWQELRQRYFRGRSLYFGRMEPQMRRHRLLPVQVLRLGVLATGLRAGARDRLTVEAFLLGLFSLLQEEAEPEQATEMPQWLRFAVEQIRLFPNFAGGPAAFARLAGRSPEHVARECRRYVGRPPNDLVNEARMEYAARELKMDQKKIVEIALDCGIENLGHFYQLFKKRHGLSPALYRRRNHEPVRFS